MASFHIFVKELNYAFMHFVISVVMKWILPFNKESDKGRKTKPEVDEIIKYRGTAIF
jgi:hypothetical protein